MKTSGQKDPRRSHFLLHPGPFFWESSSSSPAPFEGSTTLFLLAHNTHGAVILARMTVVSFDMTLHSVFFSVLAALCPEVHDVAHLPRWWTVANHQISVTGSHRKGVDSVFPQKRRPVEEIVQISIRVFDFGAHGNPLSSSGITIPRSSFSTTRPRFSTTTTTPRSSASMTMPRSSASTTNPSRGN